MDKQTFEKLASEIYTGVPQYMLDAAYNVYDAMPVKSAAMVLGAYEQTKDQRAKIAFEIIGGIMVKQANPLVAVGTALRGASASVATHLGLAGASAAMSNSGNKNTLIQGSHVPEIERGE